MGRLTRIVVLSGLMALAGAWLTAPPAGAMPPEVTHTKVSVTLTDLEICGFTVDSVIHGTETNHVFFDRSGNVSIQTTSHVTSALTNQSNGKVVYVTNAGRDRFDTAPVLNPNGTLTSTDTLTGITVRIYTSHSNTLAKDVGYLSMVTTLDVQGNVLDFQLIEHGPHPLVDSDFALFCDAITSAIG